MANEPREKYRQVFSESISRGLLRFDNHDFWRAWHAAYKNSYNHAALPDELGVVAGSFEVDSKSYPAVFMRGIDHAARRALMARAPSYQPKSDEYPGLNTSACALCANLAQLVDFERGATDELSALWFDTDHAWIVNKFPYVRGDSLILPRRHDDLKMRHRVIRGSERGQGTRSIERRPGATAGAKIHPDFLAKAFALADRFGQVAHRNHAIDGMSMPEHDHLKLIPEEHPIWSLCIKELSKYPEKFCGEATDTPFATLIIKDHTEFLSERVAELCNRLEDDQVVFTFIYNRGGILITPRAGERVMAADVDVWIGNGVSGHIFEEPEINPEHLRRAKAYTAMKNKFNWHSYIGFMK